MKIIEKLEENPNYSKQYRNLLLIQKLFIRMISYRSLILYAQLRYFSKQKQKASSAIQKETLLKIQILDHFRQIFIQYPIQNTPVHDLMPLI